ncbi:MAG: SHOCT domain-containing protein [Acidimicrobiales bacterium]
MVRLMFWYYRGGWGFWEIALMWLAMIAFWAFVGWGVYAIATGATRRPGERRDGDAHHLLDERLARGEIDAEEYRRLDEVLSAAGGRRHSHTGAGR